MISHHMFLNEKKSRFHNKSVRDESLDCFQEKRPNGASILPIFTLDNAPLFSGASTMIHQPIEM